MRNKELLEKVELFQNMLVSFSTGGGADETEYKKFREELLADPVVMDFLPRFIRTCRDLGQFWQFIKYKFATYQERRQYLWNEFGPIIDMLEAKEIRSAPSDNITTDVLSKVDSDTIHEAWRKALERRYDDSEGAITAARSLIETVCKYILDDAGIHYENDLKLPELYHLTSECLNLALGQQSELSMKRIYGSVFGIVDGIGSLRNTLGDAHGRGEGSEVPEVRHAELAVNLAGSISTFLISSYQTQKRTGAH